MRPRVRRLKGIYVYRLYDAGGAPVYIGCTNDLWGRMGSHRARASWWPLVSSVKLTGPFLDRRGALDHEARAIMREAPRFNEVHHPRRDLAFVRRVVPA